MHGDLYRNDRDGEDAIKDAEVIASLKKLEKALNEVGLRYSAQDPVGDLVDIQEFQNPNPNSFVTRCAAGYGDWFRPGMSRDDNTAAAICARIDAVVENKIPELLARNGFQHKELEETVLSFATLGSLEFIRNLADSGIVSTLTEKGVPEFEAAYALRELCFFNTDAKTMGRAVGNYLALRTVFEETHEGDTDREVIEGETLIARAVKWAALGRGITIADPELVGATPADAIERVPARA